MGAFSKVRLPLDLTRRALAVEAALEVIHTYPGVREAALEASTLVFEFDFPGNLTDLARRLVTAKVPPAGPCTLRVAVRNLAPWLMNDDPELFAHRTAEGPEIRDVALPTGKFISDARIEGGEVIATLVPSTSAVHELYDVLLNLGLVADDSVAVGARA